MSSDRKQKQYLQEGNSPGISKRGKDPDRSVRFARCARSASCKHLPNILEPSLAFLIYKLFFITLGRLGRVLEASWRVCKCILELKSPENNKSLIAH